MKILFYTLFLSLFAVSLQAQNVVTYSNLAPSRTTFVSFHDKKSVRDSLAEASKYYKRLENVSQNKPYNEKFKFPFTWVGMELFLHIEGAPTGYRVFVNDREVGHYLNGKSHAEFDVTPFAHEGMNTLRLEAIASDPLATGSEQTRNEGMVYLTAEPKVRMRDYVVDTKLTDNGVNGALDLGVVLKSHFINPKKITVFCDLYTPDGKLITTLQRVADFKMRSEDTVHFTHLVTNVKAWSAENPELYRAVLSINYEGHLTQLLRLDYGFRDVRIDGQKLLINGRPIVLKGVVMPETSLNGATVSDSIIIKNLLKIKAMGANAIRPATHPFATRFYDLCDQIGLYVIDMAAVNGTNAAAITDNPTYTDAVIQRIVSMYDRSKNHPSVIAFAMGAADANGFNMYEANLALKQKETSRPIVYAAAQMDWNSDLFFKNEISGATDRPSVINQFEYSPGAMMIYTSPKEIQGGFITDYEQHRAAIEEVFEPLKLQVRDLRRGDFLITNRFDFLNLDKYRIIYRVMSGNKIITTGEVSLSAEPGATTALSIPLTDLKIRNNKSYVLEVKFVAKNGAKLTEYQRNFNLN